MNSNSPLSNENVTLSDFLFNELNTLNKAAAYGYLLPKYEELKKLIIDLIDLGELESITFTDEEDTRKYREVLNALLTQLDKK
jgi:hypothetical protein